jgi:hypothetical protein
MNHCSLPHDTSTPQEAAPRTHAILQSALSLAERRKAVLVNLGLYALSHGHWQMVDAITRVIRERGWRHA